MRKAVRLASAALAASLAGIAAPHGPAQAQDAIRLGTSSIGSTNYILAVGMSQLVRKHAAIDATVEPLGGTTAIIDGLGAKKVDFAMVSAGAAFDGAHGNAPFRRAVPVGLIAQGRSSMRFVLVRRDAGIRSVADLAGKTMIGKRRSLPDLELIANALLDVHGVPKDKVKFVETVETAQATAALRAGNVEAAVYPGRLDTPPLQELFRDKVVDFLDIPEATMRNLVAKLPKYFYLAKVPAGNFQNQPKEWISPALNTYLVARSDAPEELVYKVTKAIMGNPAGFAAYHVEGSDWTVANALAEPKLAFHPGAIRYYKEIGAWQPVHDQLQASLQAK